MLKQLNLAPIAGLAVVFALAGPVRADDASGLEDPPLPQVAAVNTDAADTANFATCEELRQNEIIRLAMEGDLTTVVPACKPIAYATGPAEAD